MALSDDDRDLLADAPAAVFALVAGADGKVDDRERKRFEELLEASAAPDSPVLADLIARARERSGESLGGLDAAAAEARITEVAEVAGRALSAEDAAAFKRGLLFIAERIASASGGGVLRLGKRTAKEERAAIDRLQALLG